MPRASMDHFRASMAAATWRPRSVRNPRAGSSLLQPFKLAPLVARRSFSHCLFASTFFFGLILDGNRDERVVYSRPVGARGALRCHRHSPYLACDCGDRRRVVWCAVIEEPHCAFPRPPATSVWHRAPSDAGSNGRQCIYNHVT